MSLIFFIAAVFPRGSRPRQGYGFQADDAEALHFQDCKAVGADSDFVVDFRRMAQGIEDVAADGIGIDIVFDGDVQQFFDVVEEDRPGKFVSAVGKGLNLFFFRRVFVLNGADQFFQDIFEVKAVDTTAAGDTFTGYFIAAVIEGRSIQEALRMAAKASSIAVSRPGATPSIPRADEVKKELGML